MKAVIDIGSNSILLLVAERDADGKLIIERDEARVARLSEGADRSGMLTRRAIERSLNVLRDYAAAAVGMQLQVVATEGVRMAKNSMDFLAPAARVLGVPVRIVSGEEEAKLSFKSVALEMDDVGPLRVLDIGGASTELVVGYGLEIERARSLPIGSVRLTERHVKDDPPTRAQLAAMEDEARRALATIAPTPKPELHGLAGTVTTMAALLLGLHEYDRDRVDGTRFEVEPIRRLRDELAAQTVAERLQRPCLGPGRADVVVAGLTILLAALEACGATTLVVRDRGLRYALV